MFKASGEISSLQFSVVLKSKGQVSAEKTWYSCRKINSGMVSGRLLWCNIQVSRSMYAIILKGPSSLQFGGFQLPKESLLWWSVKSNIILSRHVRKWHILDMLTLLQLGKSISSHRQTLSTGLRCLIFLMSLRWKKGGGGWEKCIIDTWDTDSGISFPPCTWSGQTSTFFIWPFLILPSKRSFSMQQYVCLSSSLSHKLFLKVFFSSLDPAPIQTHKCVFQNQTALEKLTVLQFGSICNHSNFRAQLRWTHMRGKVKVRKLNDMTSKSTTMKTSFFSLFKLNNLNAVT